MSLPAEEAQGRCRHVSARITRFARGRDVRRSRRARALFMTARSRPAPLSNAGESVGRAATMRSEPPRVGDLHRRRRHRVGPHVSC